MYVKLLPEPLRPALHNTTHRYRIREHSRTKMAIKTQRYVRVVILGGAEKMLEAVLFLFVLYTRLIKAL